MSRITMFLPGGGKNGNRSTSIYNNYKPGGGGIGGSSISNRRAKNRLATICAGGICSPCYNRLGLYSQNPNGYVPCIDNITPTQNPPLQGNLSFYIEFANPMLRTFSISEPPSQQLINAILPIVTVPGVFEITHTATIVDNRVYVEIQTLLYEQPTYTSNFGLGFNKSFIDPDIPGPEIPLRVFYNSMYNLTFTSSNNVPFNKSGSQFKELTTDFTLSSDFKPYFLPGTSLTSCFADCGIFNSDISTWDVSNVIDMSYMFSNAIAFNQPIGSWDVSNVTTMESMFEGAISFKQDISNWSPYLCINMINMFSGCDINDPDSLINQEHYNALLESWGVTKLSNMQTNVTFDGGNSQYSSSGAVTGWDNLTNPTTKNWTITDGGNSSSINIEGQLHFYYIYNGEISYDTVISNLPVVQLPGKFSIYTNPIVIITDIGGGLMSVDVTINSAFNPVSNKLGDFGFTFNNVVSFYNDNTSNLNMISSNNFPFSKMGFQFNDLTGAFSIETGFQPYILPDTSLRFCFGGCGNFNSDIGSWDVSQVTNMAGMFGNTLFNQDISSWDVSQVTNMSGMFLNNSTFNQEIGVWNTSQVTNMFSMFFNAPGFNQPINYNPSTGAWNTSNVINMSFMFANTIFDKEIGLWDVSQVTNMAGMFLNNSTFNQEIGVWNTSQVTNMFAMFANNSTFNQDISSWDVSQVTDMQFMFYNAYEFNQPIGSWDVSQVTNMAGMFYDDFTFKQDISNWTPSACRDMSAMFFGCDINNPDSNDNQDNYNALLESWGVTKLSSMPSTVTFNGGTSRYSSSAAIIGRDTLTNPFIKNWTITDGGRVIEGALQFSYVYDGAIDEPTVLTNLPVLTLPGVFEITHSVTITPNDGLPGPHLVEVSINSVLYESSSYSGDFGFTFNIPPAQPDTEPDNLTLFYRNNTSNLTFISSNNFPFSKMGYQFASLHSPTYDTTPEFLIINPAFVPYFLPNTSLTYCFYACTSFNSDISSWMISHVIDMSYMFQQATSFNQDISLWTTSSVISMEGMFLEAVAFEQEIGVWDVSKVINMRYMFEGATLFNKNISSWDTTRVINMSYMFSYAISFNQPIGTWNTSNVMDMSYMFQQATSFKQDISNWTPYACTDMTDMFSGCDINNPNSNDNQDNYNALLSSWGGISKLNNMKSNVTFNGGSSRYSSSDAIIGHDALTTEKSWTITDGGISGPTTYGTLNFSYVYDGVILESTVINNLPVLLLTDVFEITPSVTITPNDGLPGPHLVEVSISSVLYESSSYPSDFGFTFNINNLITFYNSNISDLNIISSEYFPFSRMNSQFYGLTVPFTIDPGFKPYFLPGTSLRFCFGYCSNFNSNIVDWKTSNVIDMSYMFSNATAFNQPINYNASIGAWNTSNVTDMSYMFYEANSFDSEIDLWNTSTVINMEGMFSKATSFNKPINTSGSNWNTSSVTNMVAMFSGAILFNQPIDLWDVSNVTNMSYMFSTANSFNGDISSWDVSSVTNMTSMFSGNSGNIPIFNGDISSWDTSSVILMNAMFYYAPAFNQPLNTSGSNWNTSNVTDMSFMFYEATTFNQDISLWNVLNVTAMDLMFFNAAAFKQDISNWTPYACESMSDMFSGVDINNPNSTDNQTNYNALLSSWGGIDKLSSMKSNVIFNGGTSQYTGGSLAETGRTALITTNNWTISDGGDVIPGPPRPEPMT